MNNGKICVSVCAETADEMIARIKQADSLADVIEVRFDCVGKTEVTRLLENLPETDKTYLFTFRPKEQGGKRELTIGEKLNFWEQVFFFRRENFSVDIECDPSLLFAINPSKIERIVSFHDFSAVGDLALALKTMSELAGGTVKIAVQTDDVTDGLSVWKLLDRAAAKEKNIIPIAMGEAGKWTRILGLAHGSYMTYASLSEGQETADGQIAARDLKEVYRVKELDLNTKVYGVIGDPVSESLSPYIHNAAFVEQNINAVFIPLQVTNLDEFIRRMVRPEAREVELNFCGFAVTMPHKQAIIKHLDAIDPTAEKIAAVNTVKIYDGKLTGYNTDAFGFIMPLKERFGDLKGARVAVFGSGGAARACVFALKQEGANVTVFARDASKGAAFAEEFGVEVRQYHFNSVNSYQLIVDSYEGIVNATPLGMRGPLENETLFTADDLKSVKFVYDLVTRCDDTPQIREVKKVSVPAIGGIEMLLYQGAKQFKIWTGQAAPMDVMRDAVFKKMNDTRK